MIIRNKIVGYIITQVKDEDGSDLYCHPLVPDPNSCDIDIGLNKDEEIVGLLPSYLGYEVHSQMPDGSKIILGYETGYYINSDFEERDNILEQEYKEKHKIDDKAI
jgi:hypothetical protein